MKSSCARHLLNQPLSMKLSEGMARGMRPAEALCVRLLDIRLMIGSLILARRGNVAIESMPA